MGIIVGSARISENGSINGRKGDQTGREVATEAYYLHSKGWDVLRGKKWNTRQAIALNMRAACANDNLGYGQNDRYDVITIGKNVGYNAQLINTKCNCDCSSLIRLCVLYAQIFVSDFYTGNEYDVLMATGEFEDVTDKINASTGEGLMNGDILVTKSKGHTVAVVSGGAYDPEPNPHFNPEPVAADEEAIYRIVNSNAGIHMFTADINEANFLIDNGWRGEGVAWIAPKESNIPLYRLYNPNNGQHMFAKGDEELHNLVEVGWKFEGIAYHGDPSNRKAVYRLYNPNTGEHFFATDVAEKNAVVAAGWSDEGCVFYGIR